VLDIAIGAILAIGVDHVDVIVCRGGCAVFGIGGPEAPINVLRIPDEFVAVCQRIGCAVE
jgi:hypothetical protein